MILIKFITETFARLKSSLRFKTAIVAVIAALITDVLKLPIEPTTVLAIAGVIAAWILGESNRPSTPKIDEREHIAEAFRRPTITPGTKTYAMLIACSLCLCSTAYAQVELSYTKAKSLVGITAPRIIGDRILVGDDSKPSLSQVAVITVKTQSKFVKLKARKSLFEVGEVTKVSDTEYLLAGAGRYAVEVVAFDPDRGIDEATIEVVLDGVSPTPPPTPDPPDPPDPPEPVKSFRVIFVKESGSTLPAEQTAIPGAKAIRDYLTAKTTPEGGFAGWREYDPQQNVTHEKSKMMKDLWAATKSSITTVPCIIVEVNGKATVVAYPKDVAEALETLKKAGGN